MVFSRRFAPSQVNPFSFWGGSSCGVGVVAVKETETGIVQDVGCVAMSLVNTLSVILNDELVFLYNGKRVLSF
jgi:hypothetical protein